MARPKAVVFGAGSIGRGFMAKIFSESGYETVFLDIVPELLDALNARDSYDIEITGEQTPRVERVTDFRAIRSDSYQALGELATCEIAATCVGARALPVIAPVIAAGAVLRMQRDGGPLDIILAENQAGAGKIVRDAVYQCLDHGQRSWADACLGLVEASIGRIVPRTPECRRRQDPLLVITEAYSLLPVDRAAFKGEIPRLRGLVPFEPFAFYEQRKLYMHNMAHALCAYMGHLEGCQLIWETVAVPEIRSLARRALLEVAHALAVRYGVPEPDLLEHGEDLLRRFANRAMGDTVARVGADPIRKLRPSDRLVGAARCVEEAEGDMEPLARAIAAALLFDVETDIMALELRSDIGTEGVENVLKARAGIAADEPLGRLVLGAYDELSDRR